MPLELHIASQSSCNTIRGMPLKTMAQKAQREARKWMESHRFSEFLVLSSNILAFLSRHTTQIKVMHAVCHKTNPLLDDPKPLKLMDIMSEMFLGGIQSILANWNNLCHNPIVNEQCRKKWFIVSPYFIHNLQMPKLRAL